MNKEDGYSDVKGFILWSTPCTPRVKYLCDAKYSIPFYVPTQISAFLIRWSNLNNNQSQVTRDIGKLRHRYGTFMT